jgi:hypothetical protein
MQDQPATYKPKRAARVQVARTQTAAVAYMREYGALPLDRLSQLISQLQASSLLEGAAPVLDQAPADEPAFRMSRVAHTAFQREVNWQGADRFFGAFYRRIGWVFFTHPALVVLALIAVIGLASFDYLHWAEDYRLFRVNNSYSAATIVMLLEGSSPLGIGRLCCGPSLSIYGSTVIALLLMPWMALSAAAFTSAGRA